MDDMTDGSAQVNVRFWDSMATAHGAGDTYYDLDALAAGRCSLSDVEAAAVHEAVGSVDGLDVLHVQCHLGMDAVSLARQGARVTGVDFSPVALDKARALAARCDVAIDFVEADSMCLPDDLNGRFDLAYATVGVICWIADLDAWMRSVTATLRPGGRLVVCEFSQPTNAAFGTVYREYLMQALPKVARRVSSNPESYVYLAESIQAWPDQRALAGRIAAVGWSAVEWRNLTGGIVAIHRATRA
jgi:demethylmenaquinone methyltransferase/2-methoxy-6-polyprenyl-1,4-benzoquinol methylase